MSKTGTSTKQAVPDVGERPMLTPEQLAATMDMTRDLAFDRMLPDGRILRHLGQTRNRPQTLFYRMMDARHQDDQMNVWWGRNPTEDHGYLWCLSASYPRRYPTWEEMKMLREKFFRPDIDVALILPRDATPYINDNPYMLWMWETPTPWNWPSARATSDLLSQKGIQP